MTTKEVQKKIAESQNPVFKIIHKNDSFKVIAIGFKNGAVLKEHKTTLPAKLTVIEGKVKYIEADKSVILSKFDEYSIPVNIFHAVEALEDSICILTQG